MLYALIEGDTHKKMTKQDCIEYVLKCIYKDNYPLVLNRNVIKRIEKFYLQNYEKFKNANDMLNSNEQTLKSVSKSFTSKQVILKQFNIKKALQPGIIFECSAIQTLASIFGLNCIIDLESNINPIVPNIVKSIVAIQKCRYIYYNQNWSMCIIQCGNPLTNDAKIVMDDIVINCEIKSMPSLLADLDLLYDENGKYIMPDDERYDGYTDIISYFNRSNSVYMQSGSNYKIFEYLPTAIADDILENYFNLSNIDIIISCDKKNNIIALLPENLLHKENGKFDILDVSKSEIRPTGKNYKQIFTPLHFQDVLNEKHIGIKNGIVTIYKANDSIIGKIHGRGKNKSSFDRLKIDNLFFVKARDVIEKSDRFEFNISSVKQSKSGISIHTNILKPKQELKTILYK